MDAVERLVRKNSFLLPISFDYTTTNWCSHFFSTASPSTATTTPSKPTRKRPMCVIPFFFTRLSIIQGYTTKHCLFRPISLKQLPRHNPPLSSSPKTQPLILENHLGLGLRRRSHQDSHVHPLPAPPIHVHPLLPRPHHREHRHASPCLGNPQ